MSKNVDKIFEYVLCLAKDCGKLIRERIWAQKTVELKTTDVDLVTETDKEVEKRLIGSLSSQFPEHKFIGEEATAAGIKAELTDAPTWIIDPVDGTMNFVHGYPIVCISIALLIKRTPEIGIIYNPVLEYLFTAKRGQGAFLNGKKMKVSAITELQKSLIQVEIVTSREAEKLNIIKENLNILIPRVHAIRSSGSSAWNMAMVGLGGSDAYFEFGLHAWDMAAGDLIVREAGGIVMDPCGGPLDIMSCRLLCSSTEKLARQLASILKQYYPPRDD